MNEFKEGKKKYDSIEIPNELTQGVEDAIFAGKQKSTGGFYKKFKGMGVLAASLCLFFMGAVNASPVFAQSMENVPVLGQLAKVVSFAHVQQEDDIRLIDATIPAIENTGNTPLEKRINDEIALKINQVVKDAEQRALEYKEAYLATGGEEDARWKMEISVDYEVKCSNEQVVSFVISKTESLASIYYEEYFYNIDLETGKELTLKDCLGVDYQEKIKNSVLSQVEERSQNKNNLYYVKGEFNKNDENYESYTTLEAETAEEHFYINDKGNVVMVYEKYSIAPGYMGKQEFEIIK